jgi:hypothetical protein
MPPRRRQGKGRQRVPLNGDSGTRFLFDDGVDVLLDWYPPNPTYSIFEARAVWEQVRTVTWRHELRDLWPPVAALRYDGITQLTKAQRPHRPYRKTTWTAEEPVRADTDTVWTLEGLREAVEADVASVEAFRQAKPTAAAEIAEELDGYVEDVRMLLTLMEQGSDVPDDESLPARGEAWSRYEDRRRPR